QRQHVVETAVGAQSFATGLGRPDQLLLIEIGEDGEIGYDLPDAAELRIGHGAVHGRHGDHRIDKCGVMVERFGHGARVPVVWLRREAAGPWAIGGGGARAEDPVPTWLLAGGR